MGRQTIQHFRELCKPYFDAFLGDWGLFLLLALLCVASFILGRLSALIEARPLIALAEAPSERAVLPLRMGGLLVASWGGSVYYYPWCSGAQNIKPENQRWFTDEKSAQAAGYRAAKNCQGLTQ
jgi:hypothetical protein